MTDSDKRKDYGNMELDEGQFRYEVLEVLQRQAIALEKIAKELKFRD